MRSCFCDYRCQGTLIGNWILYVSVQNTVSCDTCHPHLQKVNLLSLRKQALIISLSADQTPFRAIKKIFWLGSASKNFSLNWTDVVIRVIGLQAVTLIHKCSSFFYWSNLLLVQPKRYPLEILLSNLQVVKRLFQEIRFLVSDGMYGIQEEKLKLGQLSELG